MLAGSSFQRHFNESKYTRVYFDLVNMRIQNPLTKSKSQYTEVHHILPESLGGDNTKENKVRMTGREHALCHWLLTKMTVGDDYEKMVYAFNMMRVKGEHMGRTTSRMITRAFERNKAEWSRLMSEARKGIAPWNKDKKLDSEKYGKGGRSNKGRVLAPEVAEAKRLRQIGKKQKAETVERRRASMTGFVRGPQSDEHRLAISASSKGVKKKEGHGDNVAAAVLGNISINKDGKEKRVKRHQLQEFLDDGWSLGGRLRNKKQK